MNELDFELSSASGVPRYRQIVDRIAELVQAGRLRSGEKLPSVRDLAPRLLVSLITVRKAYADLEREGLIVSRQGQGTFVSESVGQASEKRAQTEGRAVLTQAVSRARALGLDPPAIRDHVRDVLATEKKEKKHDH